MKYLLWGDTFTCFKFEDAKEEKKILGKLLSRQPGITEAFTHPTIETSAITEECIHIFDEREEDPRCKKCGCFYPGFGGNNVDKNAGHY